MKFLRIFTFFSVVLTTTAAQAVVNATPTYSPITAFATGWSSESVRVQRSGAAFYNPESCPTLDGYVTNPADPGVKLQNSTLMSAFLAGKSVQLIIDGCISGRPKIIGVYVNP